MFGRILSEEKPPEKKSVLMCDADGCREIGHYDGKGWNVREYITDLGVDVKAWRPLPEPYRPERSE